jgi:hypothetical protein
VARIYADEDFSRGVIEALRILGHDVLTVQEAGQAEQQIPDAAVLAFAHAHGRAVLTFNRWDFIKLHKRRVEHSGIIACTRDPRTGELALRIHDAIQGELRGLLIRINRPARQAATPPPTSGAAEDEGAKSSGRPKRRIIRPGEGE